jgi:protein TonB
MQTHKTHPETARARGDQGSASVRFTVRPDGAVTDVRFVQGTGSATLDEAVRALLTNARVPPFPAEMTQSSITVTVRIDYSLRR